MFRPTQTTRRRAGLGCRFSVGAAGSAGSVRPSVAIMLLSGHAESELRVRADDRGVLRVASTVVLAGSMG